MTFNIEDFHPEITTPPLERHKDYQGWRTVRDDTRRNRPFIAWDGEGYTDDNGEHHYSLFGSSTGLRVSGDDISWKECLPLLFEAPKAAYHVIFAGTYDVTMMFRNLFGARKLLSGQPCRINKQYRATFYKGKKLQITDTYKKETRILYDVFSFFNKSFVKACKEYLGDLPILEDVQRMKENRGKFTRQDILEGTDVSIYMGQELELLVMLCDDLRAKLAAVDIHPSFWHGPGAIASTILRQHKVKKAKGDYSDEFRTYAEAAYYGGRFEQFQRGAYEGKVYQYDIRSAYPNAMRYLPSLAHVNWKHEMDTPSNVDIYGLYHVNYAGKYRASIVGPLPHRTPTRRIVYSNQFAIGWYWGVEIPQSLHTDIDEYWQPEFPLNATNPLLFIPEMYDKRAQLKREGKAEQLALKLAMNSGYGKLAQSKGAHVKDGILVRPGFHEIVWAGWITAKTRQMIREALWSVPPNQLIATETDSVFSIVPLNLDVGPGLGQWELVMYDGIKYIANGISLVKYCPCPKCGIRHSYDKSCDEKCESEWGSKSRGFSYSLKGLTWEIEQWDDLLAGRIPDIGIRQNRFGTDPRNKNFSKWYDMDYRLSLTQLNQTSKRQHFSKFCPACVAGKEHMDNTLHTLFVTPTAIRESTAYRFAWAKDIEMEGVDYKIDKEQEATMQMIE